MFKGLRDLRATYNLCIDLNSFGALDRRSTGFEIREFACPWKGAELVESNDGAIEHWPAKTP